MNKSFDAADVVGPEMLGAVTDLRVRQPQLIEQELRKRKRRAKLSQDGCLVILAADHPARMVTGIPGNPVGMGDRHQYLARIFRVLSASRTDGLMATSDVIDEIVLLNYLNRSVTGKDVLKNRLLIGSMNRTGLAGLRSEMLDQPSAYLTGARIKQMGLDGGKILLRIPEAAEDDHFANRTLAECARLLDELAALKIPAFVEPLPVRRTDTGFKTIKEPDPLIRVVGVATALGYTSARMWIKIPYTTDYERVARSTTCPILMLGGEATGNPQAVVEEFSRGMKAAANVRGALVGRNVLFPGDEDPAVVAEAICAVVHDDQEAGPAWQKAKTR